MLSVVLPAYNEEKMIQKAADTLDRILGDAEIPYELVFVNDGSKDGTWAAIEAAFHGISEKNRQCLPVLQVHPGNAVP